MHATNASLLSSPLLPWCDRNGRFSPLRLVALLAVIAPAVWLGSRWWFDDLGPRPLTEAIHVAGDWAARLLVAEILVTPLRFLSQSGRIVAVRRTIGLASLAWALFHVGAWVVDRSFDVGTILREVLVRPYLTIGAAALVGLLALGITSRDAAIRRMGPAWKRLHGLVHPITILVLIHVYLQSRLDLTQPAWLTGLACGGLAIRLASRRGARRITASVVGVVAAFATATIGEAIGFMLKTGRSPLPLLVSSIDFETRIAPGWIAAVALALAAIGVMAFASRTSAAPRGPRLGPTGANSRQ